MPWTVVCPFNQEETKFNVTKKATEDKCDSRSKLNRKKSCIFFNPHLLFVVTDAETARIGLKLGENKKLTANWSRKTATEDPELEWTDSAKSSGALLWWGDRHPSVKVGVPVWNTQVPTDHFRNVVQKKDNGKLCHGLDVGTGPVLQIELLFYHTALRSTRE